MSEARETPSGSLRRNAIANVTGRSASVLVWVVLTPLVLSRLGQERFAVWSLFLGLGGNVASLDLGMASGVGRYVALATARGDRANLILVLRRSLALSAGVGLLWCIACIMGRGLLISMFHVPPALQSEVSRSLVVFALSMFAYSLTQVLHGALAGFQRLDQANICYLSGLALHATTLVVGLTAGAGLIAVAVAAIGGHALSGLLAAMLVRRSLRQMPVSDVSTPVTWREILRFGGSVQGTAACSMGQHQSWNYLLGILGQLRWVTQFSLGFRVANAVWSLPSLVQGAVIPAAAHASAHGDRDRVRTVYDWACRWIFLLGGLSLAGLWLMAPALLVLWLGPTKGVSLAGSVAITRLLAITFAIATMAGPATAVARGGGWPLLETWFFGLALICNVSLSLWLIPRFGPAGAAIAMGTSYTISGIWLISSVHRLLRVVTLNWLLKLVLPRFALPALAAAGVALLWKFGEPATRLEALRIVLLQGGAYLLVVVALLWPTGDPAALVGRLRSRRRAAEHSAPEGLQP